MWPTQSDALGVILLGITGKLARRRNKSAQDAVPLVMMPATARASNTVLTVKKKDIQLPILDAPTTKS